MISDLSTPTSAPWWMVLVGALVLVAALALVQAWQARQALLDSPPFSLAELKAFEHNLELVRMDDESGTDIPMSRRYAAHQRWVTGWH